MSDSSSYNQSSSASGSFQFPANDLLQQIAQIASNMGQSQYAWAQQQFAKNSALTDQAVGDYMHAAHSADALAQNNLSRYTGKFQPIEDQLIQDANTYNSKDRQRFEMARSEGDTAQTMDAGRLNAERQLQAYGIDPSSGRYAELERASATARAAAQAGAGQLARQNTENVGRQLRGQAIQVGQQYPGQIVNALNSQVQSLQGAVNSKLANANTGVNMFSSANPFLQTGMGWKYPPTGQSSNSQSSGRSQSQTQPKQSSQNGNNGNNGNKSGNQNGDYNPYGNQTGSVNNPGSKTIQAPGPTGADRPENNPSPDWSSPEANWDQTQPYSNPFGLSDGGGNQIGNEQVNDTNSQPLDMYDWQNLSSNDQPQDGPYADSGSSYTDTTGMSGDYYGDPSSSTDTSGWDLSSMDTADYGGGDSGGDYGGDYARGGPVLRFDDGGDMDQMAMASSAQGSDATSGGFVPQQASPSMGQNVDDIPANLNSEEFVVPRDVARWKGEEFFHKLIEQSRKLRMQAKSNGVGGKPGRQAPGPPRFASQSMGA